MQKHAAKIFKASGTTDVSFITFLASRKVGAIVLCKLLSLKISAPASIGTAATRLAASSSIETE